VELGDVKIYKIKNGMKKWIMYHLVIYSRKGKIYKHMMPKKTATKTLGLTTFSFCLKMVIEERPVYK
jgi:hypothetical protein